jgi:hypothetical protein
VSVEFVLIYRPHPVFIINVVAYVYLERFLSSFVVFVATPEPDLVSSEGLQVFFPISIFVKFLAPLKIHSKFPEKNVDNFSCRLNGKVNFHLSFNAAISSHQEGSPAWQWPTF